MFGGHLRGFSIGAHGFIPLGAKTNPDVRAIPPGYLEKTMETKKISELFGVAAPDSAQVSVPSEDERTGPIPKMEHHVFDALLLKILMLWISPRAPRHNLLLTGNAGTGKTSVVLQFAARMGIPVWSLGVSGKTRYEHLVGGLQMRDGNTVWQDGPLLAAWRHGGIFLANEITRMDAGEQMRLVDSLDKQGRITIGETGEVVERHPSFRFAATGNSGGFGDESGAYPGEKVASAAFMDRFIIEEIQPLSEESETEMVRKAAPSLPEDVLKGMVLLARTVRDSFVGNGGALRISISPRALCDWAMMTCELQAIKGIEPVRKALELIVLNGKPMEDRQVVLELYENWMGKP